MARMGLFVDLWTFDSSIAKKKYVSDHHLVATFIKILPLYLGKRQPLKFKLILQYGKCNPIMHTRRSNFGII
jgi:hypothetical protein